MRKAFKKIFWGLLVLFLIVVSYFFIGTSSKTKNIVWGVNFSQKHSQNLGLDWRKNYLALINDLGAKHIRVASYWDLIEPEKDKFYFDDLDWQIETAEQKGVKVILVMGQKTPRWPECHLPKWAKNLNKEEQQERILNLIKKIVLRYSNSLAIERWQVENEPFFPFGECSWVDKEFLKKEIDLVKKLDFQKRPVIISDSGEGSLWIEAARLGDIVGTTMYKKVWVRQMGIYLTYPFPPIFYYRKMKLINWLFHKEVICVEFQAEPWGPKLLYDSPIEEQIKTMNIGQFRYNIDFAKRTGIKEFYLWGGEWWYWMKEKQGKAEMWQEARRLFGSVAKP